MADELKIIKSKKYYLDHYVQQIRPDGRGLLKSRPVAINVNSFSTAEGSALVRLGDTTVICGIKAEFCVPFPESPIEGFIIPSVELGPRCSTDYTPEEPDGSEIVTKNLTDIVEAWNFLDLEQLCICPEKLAWVLYCDIICLNEDGNILDASVMALCAALKQVQLPQVLYEPATNVIDVLEEQRKPLTLNTEMPVVQTFAMFEEWLLADPTLNEEDLCSTRLTVFTAGNELHLLDAFGELELSNEIVEKCLQEAKIKAPFIVQTIHKALQSPDKTAILD